MNMGIDLKKVWGAGLLFIILVLLATLSLYASAYTIILVTSILMYIVLTMSWVVFSGPTGYISLAPAAFFGFGIYTSAVLGKTLPLPLVVLIGGLASFCLALFVGALTLRLKGIYFAIFTFGLVELIKHLLLWYEINMTGTRGRFVIVVDNATIYHVMLIILVILLVVAYLIRRSRFGLALQSIGEYEDAAAHTGVNVTMVKVITFAISAIFTGAAGAIMATRWTYIDPYIAFNPLFSFMPVLMAIFGGMGQFYGPIIGAAIFAYLEEMLLTKFPYFYMLIFGTILVVTILYLPEGLVGLIQKIAKDEKTVAKDAQPTKLDRPLFLYISPARLILLSIVSMGLYEVYWIYKNWRYIKERNRFDIKPFWRGIFGYLYCHTLLRRIHEDKDANKVLTPTFPARELATGWVIFMLLANIVVFYAASIEAIIIAAIIPSFLFLVPVQGYINSVTKKRNPDQKMYGWSLGHIVCLVFGLISWVSIGIKM